MPSNENKTSGVAEVQVFELTMDNAEDQDELNRRLRKPGDPDRLESAKLGEPTNSPPAGAPGESVTESGKNQAQ
jgi:hypothetical protein